MNSAHAPGPSAARDSLVPADARRFLPQLLFWFPALLLLWFPLGHIYRTALVAAGNASFAALSGGQEVYFVHHTRWAEVGVTEMADVAVLVRNPSWQDGHGRKQHVLAKAVCTFFQPFTSLVFLWALFLASPISWRERLWKGGTAAFALHLAMAVCVAIDACHAFFISDPSSSSHVWVRTVTAMLHFSVTDWPPACSSLRSCFGFPCAGPGGCLAGARKRDDQNFPPAAPHWSLRFLARAEFMAPIWKFGSGNKPA